MRVVITIILSLFTYSVLGQAPKYINFAFGNPQDTARTNGSLLVPEAVRTPLYATNDTTLVWSWDAQGNCKPRHITGGGSGGGTVTGITVNSLSPLFTASVTGTSAVPVISFGLISQSQNLFLASPDGSSGVGSFRAMVANDLPGTINANTTGSAAKWTTPRLLAGNSVDGSANVPFANKFIVQGISDGGLSGAQFMGSLGTGIVKNTTTTGVQSIAINSDLPVMSSTVGGAVPTPPNDATKYLNGTGAWTVPTGTIYTNGTGLGLTGNTFSVNNSQFITTLSNLTTNGLVYTTGSTGVLNSGPLSGDGTTSGAAFTLATVNASPGTVGDATHVAQITVNAKGLVTSATAVTIIGTAPGGPAGGDLTGSYPSPTVGTNKVTYAKFQQVSASSLVGNPTGSLANAQGITLGAGLSFSGTTLVATSTGVTTVNVTSPITSTGGSTPTIGLDETPNYTWGGVHTFTSTNGVLILQNGVVEMPGIVNPLADFEGTVNNYLQFNARNQSSGNNASTDIVATANNGTETTHYVDIGVNGSGYAQFGVWDVVSADGQYVYGTDSTAFGSSGSASILFSGGTTVSNRRMVMTSSGAIYFPNSSFSAGIGHLASNGQLTSSLIAVPGDISATGTPSGTTFLRGDGVWATPSGGGGTDSGIVAGPGISIVRGSIFDIVSLDLTYSPTWTGIHTFSPVARTSGSAPYFKINAPADIGLTAATESNGFSIAGSTRTWADGTVATQRENLITAPTYNKTTTSATFTKAATFAISGAPTAGSGVTITNPYAFWVQAGLVQLDGGLTIAGSNSSGFALQANSGFGSIFSSIVCGGSFSQNNSTPTNSSLNIPAATSASNQTFSQYLPAGITNIGARSLFYGSNSFTPAAGNSYSSVIFGNAGMTIPGSGTSALGANVVILAPTIASGTGSLTNATSLYIDVTMSGSAIIKNKSALSMPHQITGGTRSTHVASIDSGNVFAANFSTGVHKFQTAGSRDTLKVPYYMNNEYTASLDTIVMMNTALLSQDTNGVLSSAQPSFTITNYSTGAEAIYSSGGQFIISIPANTICKLKDTAAVPTTGASDWVPQISTNFLLQNGDITTALQALNLVTAGTILNTNIVGANSVFSSTITGFTGAVTQNITYNYINSHLLQVAAYITGTSNATTFTFTIPVNAVTNSTTNTTCVGFGQSTNSGTNTNGVAFSANGSNVITMFSSANSGVFGITLAKGCNITLSVAY